MLGDKTLSLVVRIEKAAGAELGLLYVEQNGGLVVEGCKAALLEAIAGGEAQVVEGDRLVAVNGIGGNPFKLRDALLKARAATSLVLSFERNQSAMEDQVLRALSDRNWPAARQGVEDIKATGGRVQSVLLTGVLRLANEVGVRQTALDILDSMDLSAGEITEVLLIEELARDGLISAAGLLLNMRQCGHVVTVELAAQLCAAGLRLGRLNEVLPILSFLGLQPDEFTVLMKLCQSHQQDPTARFLQLYEACAVHLDRAVHSRPAESCVGKSAADTRVTDWLGRKLLHERKTALAEASLRICFSSWALCLCEAKPVRKAELSFASMSTQCASDPEMSDDGSFALSSTPDVSPIKAAQADRVARFPEQPTPIKVLRHTEGSLAESPSEMSVATVDPTAGSPRAIPAAIPEVDRVIVRKIFAGAAQPQRLVSLERSQRIRDLSSAVQHALSREDLSSPKGLAGSPTVAARGPFTSVERRWPSPRPGAARVGRTTSRSPGPPSFSRSITIQLDRSPSPSPSPVRFSSRPTVPQSPAMASRGISTRVTPCFSPFQRRAAKQVTPANPERSPTPLASPVRSFRPQNVRGPTATPSRAYATPSRARGTYSQPCGEPMGGYRQPSVNVSYARGTTFGR